MKPELYLSHPEADFWADFSFVDFPDDYLSSMESNISSALQAMQQLEGGSIANPDENRMVGHYWLRNADLAPSEELTTAIRETLAKVKDVANAVHSGSLQSPQGAFTDLLVIGIGGSALGPQFVGKALGHPNTDKLRVHFFDNTDPDGIDHTLSEIGDSLSTTLALVISKSGGTPETRNGMLEAENAFTQKGLDFSKHAIAITGDGSKLHQYSQEKGWLDFLPMWDWVGGRYSLWSAVGISIALVLGWQSFQRLLHGAHSLDKHTHAASPAENLPMAMALLELWQTHYIGANTHVVLPYAQRLTHLPDFLQQLTMESNGKRVSSSGEPLAHDTAPVLWGSAGTIGQHSYYQLLHQGTRSFSADIILPLRSGKGDQDARRALAAHALAQSRALMVGRPLEEARQLGAERGFDKSASQQFELPGNHSHSLLLLDAVSPECLGALVAAYEHKTYFLAVLLDLNPFDQWGVELGKEIAGQMRGLLSDGQDRVAVDPGTLSAAQAWRMANAE